MADPLEHVGKVHVYPSPRFDPGGGRVQVLEEHLERLQGYLKV